MKAIVFGPNGGIGKVLCDHLSTQGHEIIGVTRPTNWDETTVTTLLSKHNPDWVFNCAGKFGKNDMDYDTIFDNNVKLNWQIINHYLNRLESKVQIVTLGSTSYANGRKNYILYAASKAALHNMIQGAIENFTGTNINIGLIHPHAVDTPMITNMPKRPTISPNQVALLMIYLTNTMKNSIITEV